jgi:hypothetical protein
MIISLLLFVKSICNVVHMFINDKKSPYPDYLLGYSDFVLSSLFMVWFIVDNTVSSINLL